MEFASGLLAGCNTLVGDVEHVPLGSLNSSNDDDILSNAVLNRRGGLPAVLSMRRGEIEMVVTLYGDRWVVFCSELGKVGSILECSKEEQIFNVNVILGDREDIWLRLLGRQLVQASKQKLPLLLMLGLKTIGIEDDAMQAKLREVIIMFEELIQPTQEQIKAARATEAASETAALLAVAKASDANDTEDLQEVRGVHH